MVPNGIKYMRLKIDVHRLIVLYLLLLLMMVTIMPLKAMIMMMVMTMILGSKALCSWRNCHVPLLGGFPYLSP